ncbi:hypothetical protein EmuJ_000278900 [Echinococcus multilocularis]|uniref:Uncharacterized protein n=1 Tax=Echinococcus multilocularis TaxID=6211 RepID=A0A068XSX0_ECHMU|nr:hypothetical protein EmuJ_000278900 [Echinococcus multilocularis]
MATDAKGKTLGSPGPGGRWRRGLVDRNPLPWHDGGGHGSASGLLHRGSASAPGSASLLPRAPPSPPRAPPFSASRPLPVSAPSSASASTRLRLCYCGLRLPHLPGSSPFSAPGSASAPSGSVPALGSSPSSASGLSLRP